MEKCDHEVVFMKRRILVHTIGHSTRTIEEFIALLKEYGVERIVDIRTVPRSRHNPQFNMDALAASLRMKGFGYVHLKDLGGLRHPAKESSNTGWRDSSFRGFADYMQTEEFETGMKRLIKLAAAKRSALMCAEAVPWRCHRSLIADALTVRGVEVVHIISATSSRSHALTPFARVIGNRITYPAEGGSSQALPPSLF